MVFWRTTDTQTRKCFYCNQNCTAQTASSKSGKYWRCPLCAATNFVNPDGSIADSIPQEYQTVQTPHYRVNARPKPATLSSPFCSVCTSNQALLVKTLANYLPDDADPDIAVYQRALPAYKASLEERYPPVCSSCAPTIQARLQRNNYIAKSMALGKWLAGTKSSPRSTAKPGVAKKSLLSLVWGFRGCIWLSSSILVTSWFLLGCLSPANQKYGVLQRRDTTFHPSLHGTFASQEYMAAYYGVIRLWFPVSLLGSMWNPQALKLLWDPSLRLQGKDDYVKLQITIQVLRAMAIYIYPYSLFGVHLHMRLSLILALLSIIHSICSFVMLDLSRKPRLDLRDTAGSLQDAMLRDEEGVTTKIAFGSPVQQHFGSSIQAGAFAEPDHSSTLDSEALNLDQDRMDWQASPSSSAAPSPSPFATARVSSSAPLPRMFPKPVYAQPREHYFSSHPSHKSAFNQNSTAQEKPAQISLARQKFFAPERPTGLENLFSAAVRLDDEPLLVRSIKSVQRTPKVTAYILAMLALGLVPFVHFSEFQAAALLGTLLHIGGTYLAILKHRLRWSLGLWPSVWLSHAVLNGSMKVPRQSLIKEIYYGAICIHFIIQALAFLPESTASRQPKPRLGSKFFQHQKAL